MTRGLPCCRPCFHQMIAVFTKTTWCFSAGKSINQRATWWLCSPSLASKRPSLNKNNIQKHLFLTRQQLQFCVFSESTFPLWILRVMKRSTGHFPGFTSVPDRLFPYAPLRTFSPSESLSFSNSFLSLVSQSSQVTASFPTDSHYVHIYFGNIVYPLISCLAQGLILLRLVPVNTLMCSRIRRLRTQWKNKQLCTQSHLEGPVKHKEEFQ